MRVRRIGGWVAGGLLAALYVVALGADFFAPHEFSLQYRESPFEPPTRIRFVDDAGRFHWRPFVYSPHPEDRRTYPIRFLIEGEPRRAVGGWSVETRIFGVDEPARLFLFGTDGLGRDVFSRIVYGARVSLFAGLGAACVAVLLGFVLGTMAGFYGRWVDAALMRASELFLALPWLYLLFAVRSLMPLEMPPVQAFFVFVGIIAAIGWARPARLFRGLALSAKERGFVVAAQSFGASDGHMIRHHFVPSSLGTAWTQLALLVPRFILAEVSLSFLGLGMADSVPTLGEMLGDLRSYEVMVSYRWMFAPALVLLIVVLCFQGLEAGLRRRGR